MKKQFLFVAFLIFMLFAAPAGASYAMKIDLTGTSPAGYQVPVTIPYKTGMDANFADIRFFANSPSYISGTSIPYFIESSTASTSALIWVPVPAGATTLYAEWGLPGETASESNISQVFPFSDHFEGSALNTSRWTVPPSQSSGVLLVSSSVLTIRGNGSNDAFEEIRSKTSFAKPYEIISRAKFSGNGIGKGSWLGTRNSSTGNTTQSYTFTDFFYENNYNRIRAMSSSGITALDTNINNNWGIYGLIVQDSNYSAYFNRSAMQNSPITTNIPTDAQYIAVGSGGSSAQQIELDWIAWRSYDSTPVTGTVNTLVMSSIVAAFSANVTEGSSPLAVQFTDSSNYSVTSWHWDFGDGTNSTSQNPVHTYTINESADDAVFTVTLNVTDTAGNSDSLVRYNYIRLSSSACAAFSASQTITVVDDPIVFTDNSICSPVSWFWDFGDDTTSRARNVSHTYSQNGNYTVSLTVTNATGSSWTRTKTNYITIAAAPQVDFSGVPVSGYAPLTILFTDLSTLGGISTWQWDFGDGTSSTEQNPTHTYNTSGGYTVSLTVSNFAGRDTKVKSSYITVSYVNAAFSANATTGTTSLDVQFTDESLGNPTAWSWDFGGGASSSAAQNPVVHFAVPGLYSVKLTASNAYGVDSVTKYGYIKIADDGSATTMTITNVTDIWAYVPLNSSRDFTFSSNQAVALSYYQMNGGTVVNATNQSMAYTFTEPGYYVMEVWAENGNGQSNILEFRTRVGRALASEHLTPLNDSAYYELENATLNMSTDSILTSLVQPFTASIGRSFYLVLFVLPFLFLWFQQGKLTIPTTLALIVGCLFVHYVPDTFVTFIGLAIVLSFAANFYKISRGPN